ncbi:asparaginyl-tRNA synthetase [Thermogladius calderae 1633]|uniref:Asparagine--tRNA ligase n=1 Tax=Thermogladius calderae (strain DSM 22663 / VKM B-2946 / 1633) TaxID=1184251 RepID=I3TEN1_THEC1|nr:asparagine--tRNA ligase [Thermogladius calderae]AFK51219.1 asparaginyl-tRNA synthetase [Thermogladius calderae 1633]
MFFHQISELLSDDMAGKRVCLRGWIYRRSVVGGKAFVRVRDSTGVIQVVVDEAVLGEELVKTLKDIGLEASVEACGTVTKQPRAPTGYEVVADSFRILGYSRDFPIKGGEGVEYLLDNRHLVIRSPKYTAIWKIKHTILDAGREWFKKDGWWEVTPPILTASACEGGATLFPVQYFEKQAYLSQSAQLYLEVMIFSLEKVWSLTPSFRAEQSRTRRHLAEYWHLEAEAAWYDMEDMMRVVENLVSHIVDRVLEERRRELDALGRNVDFLKTAVETPYPRVKYDEAIEILQKKGVDIKWGSDLGADEERLLTQEFDRPFFVTHFPKEVKSFYMKLDPEDPRVVLGFDLLAPEGYGEVVGGSQREDDYDKLLQRIIENGYNVDDYKWYLDLRKYGTVVHSGFGLGIERLLMWIAGLDHIRDAIPFPRFRGRIYP